MKIEKLIFFTLGILFAIPQISLAAMPSITNATVSSGTISNENSLSITGSNFGTHGDFHTGSSQQLNYIWNNFNSLASISNEVDMGDGLIPECQDVDCHQDWLLMTTGNRTNSTKWVKRFDGWCQPNNNTNGIYKPSFSSYANYGNTLFVSFYMKVPSTASSGKFYRMYNTITSMMYTDVGGSEYDGTIRFGDWGNTTYVTDGNWHRIDIVGDTTDMRLYVDNVLEKTNTYPPAGNWADWTEPNGTIQTVLGIGKDYGSSATDYYGYDDYFVDFTKARIEICDSSTWAARSHCEIQIPTAWNSNGQTITAKINQGSFGSSDTAYLYVVNSGNEVNTTGKEIIFGSGGGGGDTTAPASPTGLSVQ